jgi:hypothetical protein
VSIGTFLAKEPPRSRASHSSRRIFAQDGVRCSGDSWSSGRGPRLFGCGTLLLVSIVIALLIYAISGGQCVFFVFP